MTLSHLTGTGKTACFADGYRKCAAGTIGGYNPGAQTKGWETVAVICKTAAEAKSVSGGQRRERCPLDQ